LLQHYINPVYYHRDLSSKTAMSSELIGVGLDRISESLDGNVSLLITPKMASDGESFM